MSWYITNTLVNDASSYRTDLETELHLYEGFSIYIDGYVLPRMGVYEQYKDLSQKELVGILFAKHGHDFIHYIKGVFVVIIFHNKKFYVFNDRHGIKKYFIYIKGNIFYISNSLKSISEEFNLTLDKENIAIFSLISHFIDGRTLFKNVATCRPAEVVHVSDGQLERSFYWQPIDLLRNRKIEKRTIPEYAQCWNKIISSYLSYLQPSEMSLTLTGGNDSRMVLSALLSSDIKLHTFTFGNPQSYDCVISQKISDHCNLLHHNYHVHNLTHVWFQNQAINIVQFGNSLINIHRAHRNDAVVKDINNYPQTEMIFTGLVGGEYIKEPTYNNIVIPRLFKTLQTLDDAEGLKILDKKLREAGIQSNKIDVCLVFKRLKRFLELGEGLNEAEKKFLYTYLFYGCAHHTQDSNVFCHHVRYVVNPFMDIDFLEFISGYEKWYLNRKQRFYHKAFHSELLVGITDFLAPQLSDIPYAKKGQYSANALLRNKPKYIFNRFAYLINKERTHYPPNFPISSWLYHFCDSELASIDNDLLEIYDIEFLRKELDNIRYKKEEANWHILTNLINIHLNYDYYKTS